MNSLIINADDLGLTYGVSKGIAESIQLGSVTRTSAMVCSENSYLIKKYGKVLPGKIGLHLQLTDGKPILHPKQVPSLVDKNGLFPKKSRQLQNLTFEDIELEWNAQMDALLKLGIKPSHIDSHQNVHRFPKAFKAICTLAQKYELPVRPLSPLMAKKLDTLGLLENNICLEGWPSNQITVKSLVQYLTNFVTKHNIKGKTLELMVHPGYVDHDLIDRSYILEQRESELGVLLDSDLPKLLHQHNLSLVKII